jgi:pimeloyl-ACP methyl ester carboxylesterase
VARELADEFTVLTFDTPGFSRSRVRSANDISIAKLAAQIAGLVETLGTYPATFYGCSSGGLAVLDLAQMAGLAALDDAAIVESCKFVFGHVMNDDLAAWEALGDAYHARLANNYVTWVRRYVALGPPPPHKPEDLAGKPITWTIGALTPAGMVFDNVVLAVKSGCPISLLNCKHFPQVNAPGMLAEHIRTNTLAR